MPVLLVNHHYFRETGTGRSIYPATPAALRAEVASLRANGWRMGDEADILSFAAGDLQPDDYVCVLTFDDGLKEQIGARRLLEEIGVGGLFFVPTAPLVERVVLDIHKLHMIRERLDDKAVAAELDRRFGLSGQVIDEELSTNQYPYDGRDARRVKYFLNFVLDEEQRLHWIRDTFTALVGDERAVAESLYMAPDEVRSLARLGALGSHAHGHVPLASLDPVALRQELERSRDILESLTGARCTGISYPFGTKPAMSAQVTAAAAHAGYRYGLTMTRGINCQEGSTVDPLALCRINSNDLGDYVSSGAFSTNTSPAPDSV